MVNYKSRPIKTVLFISTGFSLVFLITNWKWSLYFAMIIAIVGLISPFGLKIIDYLWHKLGHLWGMVVSKILLTIVFFLFLTPLAWFYKLFAQSDLLDLRNKSDTLFKERNLVLDKKTFENPW
mgnify:CR=1 FL=1|tara:strand:+ start:18484 stop:18852 length:369 start_codon:yes stop_codon:yes gene_type:complete